MDEPVDHGGRDDVVTEDLAPPTERHVRGDQERSLLVAGGDELEEQVRCGRVEGDVADLVDDEQLVAAPAFEFLVEAVGVVSVREAGQPASRGVEQDRLSRVRGLESQTDRQVSLADAGRAEHDDVLGLGNEGAGREVGQDVAA